MKDLNTVPDFGLGWLEASGDHPDVVLSTRVRLARNLQGHRFGPRARKSDRLEVLDKIRSAVAGTPLLEDAGVHTLDAMTDRTRNILLERRLVSPELAGSPERGPVEGAAVALSGRDPVGVMVNEEDHLRLQSLVAGLRLGAGWALVDRLDGELERTLSIAYHHEFGYLTSCPTNAGTGLRASVLVHLPALVLTKEIGKVLQGLGQVGLTFRGLYGEGSEVVGNFFQISNQTTLGKPEEDLIDHLDRIVRQVIHYEMQARQVLLRDAPSVTEDKIWRAYGLLRYARTLSFAELMNLLSGVRLGVSLKLLPKLSVYTLNKLMIFSQPAHLEDAAGRDLTPPDRDAHRAAYVRRVLAQEGTRPSPGKLAEGGPDLDPPPTLEAD